MQTRLAGVCLSGVRARSGIRCCSCEIVIPVTSASGKRLAMYLVSGEQCVVSSAW